MTKKAVNSNNAPVIPHVLRRSGHRTWRSSYHEPLRYRPIGAKGFLFFLAGWSSLVATVFLACTAGLTFLVTALAGLLSLALMRVNFVSLPPLLLFACFATVDSLPI